MVYGPETGRHARRSIYIDDQTREERFRKQLLHDTWIAFLCGVVITFFCGLVVLCIMGVI